MSEIEVLPPVAKSISYPCKKCAEERYHRVLTHTNETSAKIQCEICGSKKTFKLGAKKPGAKKKASTTARKKASKTLAPTLWVDLNAKFGSDKAVGYDFKTNYEPNTVLDHKKFGVGYIVRVEGQKMEVVFQDQVRNLVHGR